MRTIGAFLLFSGFLGSFSTGQEPAPTKTPDPQPKVSKSNPPINQANQPTKAQSTEVFLLTKDTPDLNEKEWERLELENAVLEIRDISIKDFIGKIKTKKNIPPIVLAESAEKMMLPLSIIRADGLIRYVVSLGEVMDSIELKQPIIEGGLVVYICGKVEYSTKPKKLFIPVNLNEILKNDKFTIKTIEDAIRRGVEMDEKMRGSISTTPLVLFVHHDTGLLFLGGQAEQVEVASRILAALGGQLPPGVTLTPSELGSTPNIGSYRIFGPANSPIRTRPANFPGGMSMSPPPTTSLNIQKKDSPSRTPPPSGTSSGTSPNIQKKDAPATIPQPRIMP